MKLGVISLNLFLLFIAIVPGCRAQNAGSTALPAEVLHRIQTEIRSRYSVPPQVEIRVSTPEPSEVPGYDKLVITFVHDAKQTPFDFLISKDRKALARLEKIGDLSQDLMSRIDVKGRPIRGGAAAKVEIVNYDDFQCPYCARMHQALSPLIQSYGDKVKIVYKDYPLLEIHPWAMHAAIDANCLGEQNSSAYWEFADYVHANRTAIGGKNQQEAFANLDNAAASQATKYHLDMSKAQACFKKQDESSVRASIAEADRLGVDSTPTVFVNGERITGIVSDDVLHEVVDRALADAGVPGPAPTSAAKQPTDTKN